MGCNSNTNYGSQIGGDAKNDFEDKNHKFGQYDIIESNTQNQDKLLLQQNKIDQDRNEQLQQEPLTSVPELRSDIRNKQQADQEINQKNDQQSMSDDEMSSIISDEKGTTSNESNHSENSEPGDKNNRSVQNKLKTEREKHFKERHQNTKRLRFNVETINYDLFKFVFSLPNLEELLISDCNISGIGNFDYNVSRLQVLDISNNNVDAKSMRLLQKLPQLKKLIAVDCNLENFPVFPKGSMLQNLEISYNKFSNIKNIAEIFTLPFLEDLNVECCDLHEIDEFDPSKCKLNRFNFRGNKFDQHSLDLIFRIPLYSSRNELDMHDMSFTYIPIFVADQFQEIDLGDNKFEDFTNLSHLFQTPKLEKLTMSDCGIRMIQEFETVSTIKFLNIGNNSLDSKSVNILSRLPCLEELQLYNCEQEVIPLLPKDTNIKKLCISHNKFVNQQDLVLLFNTPSIEDLDICSCGIYTMRQFNSSQSNVKVLNVSCNSLEVEFVNAIAKLPNLEDLNISGCKLQQLPMFPSNALIKQLNIGENQFDSVDLSSIFTLPHLQYLNLSSCSISNIESINESSSVLKKLVLQFNTLNQSLANQICQLPHLEELNMSDCCLTIVPIIPLTSKLVKLNLGFNKFENTSNLCQIFKLQHLDELNLCHCKIENIGEFDPNSCNINTINIECNSLDQASVDLIFQLQPFVNVDELNLSQYGLRFVPKLESDKLHELNFRGCVFEDTKQLASVFDLPKLENLDISGLEITHIEEFDPTKNIITQIMLSNNQFDLESLNLIVQLQVMKDLESLDFNEQGFISIPKFPKDSKLIRIAMKDIEFEDCANITSLFELQYLDELFISECNIESLGDFDPKMSAIQQLYIHDQSLDKKSIDLICLLPNLKKLHLHDCGLAVVPELPRDTKIQLLGLNGNKFEDTTNLQKIFILPELLELNLYYCNISSIGEFDPEQSRLETVDFDGNRFDQHSADLIVQLPVYRTMKDINLEYSGFTYIPKFPADSLVQCMIMHDVNFQDTSNIAFVFVLPYLKELDFNQCNITSIGEFDPLLSNIRTLSANGNPLDTSSVSLICLLPYLKTLNMSNCELKTAPIFPSSTVVKRIEMKDNEFDSTKPFFSIPSLVDLNISYCQIWSFDVASCNIEILNIAGYVPDNATMSQLFGMYSLKTLYLNYGYTYYRTGAHHIIEVHIKQPDEFEISLPFIKIIDQNVKQKEEIQTEVKSQLEIESKFRCGRNSVKQRLFQYRKNELDLQIANNKVYNANQLNWNRLKKCIADVRYQLE